MKIYTNHIPKRVNNPYLQAEDRASMLQEYRIYINTYNNQVDTLNKHIEDYNLRVTTFIKKYCLEKQAETAQSNFNKQKVNGVKNKWQSIKDYNKSIEDTNGKLLLLKKRFHTTIKANQERTFEVILWLYSKQLAELRTHLNSLKDDTSIPFPKVRITSTRIANLTKDGVVRILYSSRTVKNHIYRLRDAGIITGYEFKGTKKPVHFHINPSILVFRDRQISAIENEQISPFLMKKFPNKGERTSTLSKKTLKKIANVDNHSLESGAKNKFLRDNAIVEEKIDNDKNVDRNAQNDTTSKKAKQNNGKLGGGEKKTQNHLSQYLRQELLDKKDFLKAITAQQYSEYVFSHTKNRKRYETESKTGALSREEFRELLLQEFLKIAAPIWKDKQVYYGSWHNAYDHVHDEYLLNLRGNVPSKETLLYLFDLLLYRIEKAKRFFRKQQQYQIHFPCIYFDPTRTTASEGGFAYTLEWLKKYQRDKENRHKRKTKRALLGGKRRKLKSTEEKVRAQVKRYVKGEINLPKLYNYVETNKSIPNYFIAEIPRLVRILTSKEYDLYTS